jgi:hypothetical protein
MANQMIALQSRNPQLPDPARATAQMANMMNMASQQRAAQLQGDRIRQEMEFAKAKEGREVDTQTANIREKDVDFQLKDMKRLRNIGAAVLESGNEEAYQSLLGMIEQSDPQFGATIRQVAPTFNAKVLQTVLMEADKYIDKSVATPVASLEVDVEGNPRSVTVGGLNPQQSPVYDAPPPMANAPRATPTAPQAAPPSGPVPTGKFGETRAIRPESVPLTPDQQDHIRRMQEELGMTNTPASFSPGASAGQMTHQRAQQIVDSAVKTGMMAQEDFDQLIALTPEQNKQPFMEMIQANNIKLQPGGMGQQPQFADLRGQRMQSQTAGLRGAPPMEQTLAQTQPRTVTKLQQRDPNVSPLPGSSQVPLSRVAGEAEARRETPAQITARKNAELQATEAFEEANKEKRLGRKRQEVFEGERAKKDAAFLDSYNDAATKGRTTLNVIDQMIGDAQLEKGKLVVPKGGRRPHPGFEGVVGMGVPGVRFIPGTQAASFDALFRQAEGGAFLQAYESLRGTGQITEIEGSKATSALTRMERSQTEVEFVKAAREFANVIRGAVARADKRYTALTGEAPPAAATQRKTPTSTLSAATRKKYGL